MSELQTRENIRDYLNCDLKEAELLSYYDLVKCVTCDHVMLEEDSYCYETYENEPYCETCWDAR